VHILLPPSEGKTTPVDGPVLDLDGLPYPELTAARQQVLEALIAVSNRDDAGEILGVGGRIMPEVVAQRDILSAHCAPAREVYTGVLYEAAQLRSGDDVLIFSGLFGVTTGEDLIPAYRLSMNVSLPGIGSLKAFWRRELAQTGLGDSNCRQADSGTRRRDAWNPASGNRPGDAEMQSETNKVNTAETSMTQTGVDMRSGAYRVTAPRGDWWDLRVVDSRGKVITHAAKHYRGLLARALLDAERAQGSVPGDAALIDVAQVAGALGRIEIMHDGLRHHVTLILE
jgi:cytoplasmic iron level regulating protein YaaA (DUF328/UPF0246 family)